MTANFEKYLSHVGVRFYRSGGVVSVLDMTYAYSVFASMVRIWPAVVALR